MIVNAYNRGMGTTGNQIVGAVGGTTGGLVGALTPLLFGAAAGPIGIAVGGVIVAATALMSVLGVGGGCGQSCVEASNYVNQIGDTMKANVAAYMNGEISRTEAISNYDSLWKALTTAMNQIGGGAGKNGIEDRQQGACKWKATAPEWPGQPQVGECWNYYEAFRKPLDSNPVKSGTGGAISELLRSGSGSGGMDMSLMVIAGVGVLGLVLALKS